MNLRKLISLLILVTIFTNIFSGCSGGSDVKNSSKVQEFKITEDNPTVNADGIDILFSEYDINEETTVNIQKVEPQNLFNEEVTKEDVLVNTFEIKVPQVESFTSLINIDIPYDESFIENGSVKSNVGAMYYDETQSQWIPIPFEIDEANKKVRIITNHLSTYSVFTIKNENTRAAKIIKVNSFPPLPSGISQVFEAVIDEAINNTMTPGKQAFELGQSVVSDWLGISGATLTSITQTLYASEFASGLGNAFNNVGLAAAMVQAAYDFSSGKDKELFTNLTKNLSYFSVGRWGSNALQLSFVGVYAIDYSLNKFATAAWDGRKEIWYEAYKAYYEKENIRTAKQWYSKLYWIWQDTKESKDPNALKAAIDNELTSYVNAFWNLPDSDKAFWQSEIQKTGFSGGGGLNKKLEEEISNAHKARLVKDLQEPVFDKLEQAVRWQLTEEYTKELINLKNYLNKSTNVLITENLKAGEKAEYAGYIVRFSPLNDTAYVPSWTGKIKDDGTAQTQFTALGHIQSGAPDTLLLFEPDANPDTDEPIKEIPFKISFPNMQINLKEMYPTMDEIAGNWQTVYMTFPNIEADLNYIKSEGGECDFTAEMVELFKVARMKCKFEIQKIDETNATLVFGITSGINTSTGEALDIEPDPPVSASATYNEGVFASKVIMDDEMAINLSLDMKKTQEGNRVFENTSTIIGEDENGKIMKITINLKGQKE
ncbi:hypothetical protein SAMN02745120_1605 [Acetoanaerobium noterae]|uniref:Uncharacterized protein n=1 Tax=Acetoanaerobium noterae TaxID=745369 RepID=A0A1T5BGB7_9FIRM|nr:hypothetical protein [Acetoanaerobium noterae]SKB46351.1 hypothetical protein SAMN02745120_1605 [Acetoanaerobium noterae]